MTELIKRNAAIGVVVCHPNNTEDQIEAIDNLSDAISERVLSKVSSALQNYYCMGISEIAEEDEDFREFFELVGWI